MDVQHTGETLRPKGSKRYGARYKGKRCPDLRASRGSKSVWYEVKYKKHGPYRHHKKGELYGVDLEKYADYLSILSEEGDDVYLVICRDDTGAMEYLSLWQTPEEYYQREGQKPEAYFLASHFQPMIGVDKSDHWRNWIPSEREG